MTFTRCLAVLLFASLVVGACASTDDAAESASDVSGASQDSAAAARDGVHPAVAALTYAERVDEIGRVEVAGETWLLSRFPAETQSQFISTDTGDTELDPVSGEVLLVDGTRILLAVPLNSVPPTFITSEGSSIYVGRVGDGGYPFSALVRITVPEHRIDRVVFTQEALVPFIPPGNWQIGTNEQFDLFRAMRYEDVISN